MIVVVVAIELLLRPTERRVLRSAHAPAHRRLRSGRAAHARAAVRTAAARAAQANVDGEVVDMHVELREEPVHADDDEAGGDHSGRDDQRHVPRLQPAAHPGAELGDEHRARHEAERAVGVDGGWVLEPMQLRARGDNHLVYVHPVFLIRHEVEAARPRHQRAHIERDGGADGRE
eukprot:scaffold99800_cov63-Phaeocystis_antarctica.AAC.2